MPKSGRDSVPMYDTVGIYLEEVSAHTLLDAEDEVRLARAMEAGRKAQHRLDSGDDLQQGHQRITPSYMDDLVCKY